MALVGLLEDLGLAELFHMVSLFRKSGKLTLNGNSKTGIFLFKDGKLVHAADGTPRMPLGNLLVEKGLIVREDLDKALEAQSLESNKRRLGVVLVERGAITWEALDDVIREQLQEVAEGFLHSRSGFFSFKPLEQGSAPPKEAETKGMELSSGMNTDQFILEILTKLDEVGILAAAEADSARSETSVTAIADAAVRRESEDNLHELLEFMVDTTPYAEIAAHEAVIPQTTDDLEELRSLMVELQLRAPAFTGEITLMILRFATKVLNRGVLCRVAKEGISGIGQFGIGGDDESVASADRRVRDMLIPTHEPSVFFEVVEKMHSYRGPLKKCRWNGVLVETLGGEEPVEVVAIPIIVDGLILAIFIGDNLPEKRAIGSVQALELLMIEAGLAIERKLLRAKLKSVEEQLRLAGS